MDIYNSMVIAHLPKKQKPATHNLLTPLIIKYAEHTQSVNVCSLSAAKKLATFPLYTSKVAAGFPSPADDYIEKRLNPNDYLITNDTSTFFVQVKGDSMIDAGIFEKDILVVDRSRTAQMGDIVLAVVDGEFTVKILNQSEAGVCLIPANKNYAVIQIKENQVFEIWGVVTGSMRKFK